MQNSRYYTITKDIDINDKKVRRLVIITPLNNYTINPMSNIIIDIANSDEIPANSIGNFFKNYKLIEKDILCNKFYVEKKSSNVLKLVLGNTSNTHTLKLRRDETLGKGYIESIEVVDERKIYEMKYNFQSDIIPSCK